MRRASYEPAFVYIHAYLHAWHACVYACTEIQSKPDEHPVSTEAAVVGYPHPVKGEAIYAYVILNVGVEPSDTTRAELKSIVRRWSPSVCVRACARERARERCREMAFVCASGEMS